jgi:hypothetical protein
MYKFKRLVDIYGQEYDQLTWGGDKEMDETWYEGYDNSGCDDECRGWNGQDRRCDCGNRRVAWGCLICDGENAPCPDCYPEAY